MVILIVVAFYFFCAFTCTVFCLCSAEYYDKIIMKAFDKIINKQHCFGEEMAFARVKQMLSKVGQSEQPPLCTFQELLKPELKREEFKRF